MPPADSLRDLTLLIRSRYGLVHLVSDEEKRVRALLRHLADQQSLVYFEWTPTKGLCRDGQDNAVYGTDSFIGALKHIQSSPLKAVYHLHGVAPSLADAATALRLKDCAVAFGSHDSVLVLSGSDIELPVALRQLTAIVKLPEPTIEDYKKLLMHVARDLSQRMKISLEMTPNDLTRLLRNLQGLSMFEAEKLLTRVIVEDGRLAPNDIQKVMAAKRSIVEKEGLLEYYPVEEGLEDIAGLAGLKAWLAKRREIVVNPDKARSFGLTFPKGILLLGVQGCGKSLCAKAVGMAWGLPLLKLDPSSLYNKYIGETEKNARRAMATAERMAPVILWIDEIEKAFSGAGSSQDGGVSTRMLGQFLTWMQERKADVFVIATANNIDALPPEFLRKGRFDEIFFVDLPDAESRRAIIEIHLKKRSRDPATFDVAVLEEAAVGFSGAEIEQAIVSSLYTAFSEGVQLSTAALLNEFRNTRPLSQTMREKIEALRAWAKERTVSAH